MLHAILHGKAGRIQSASDENISWRSLFQHREDLLTAAVFGRFEYLSTSLQKSLCSVWFGERLADSLGEFSEATFWPKLPFKEAGGRYVEPDVLLRFERGTVIVEAKTLVASQVLGQWRREIEAFLKNDENDADHVVLFAVGGKAPPAWKSGVSELKSQDIGLRENATLDVLFIDWQRFANMIASIKNEAEGSNLRVLQHMHEALLLYGLAPLRKSFSPLSRLVNADLATLSLRGWPRNKIVLKQKIGKRRADWSELKSIAGRTHAQQLSKWNKNS